MSSGALRGRKEREAPFAGGDAGKAPLVGIDLLPHRCAVTRYHASFASPDGPSQLGTPQLGAHFGFPCSPASPICNKAMHATHSFNYAICTLLRARLNHSCVARQASSAPSNVLPPLLALSHHHDLPLLNQGKLQLAPPQFSPSHAHTTLLDLLLPMQLDPPLLLIALNQHLARLPKLHHIDNLLGRHDG